MFADFIEKNKIKLVFLLSEPKKPFFKKIKE